jgi:hypothetical protein
MNQGAGLRERYAIAVGCLNATHSLGQQLTKLSILSLLLGSAGSYIAGTRAPKLRYCPKPMKLAAVTAPDKSDVVEEKLMRKNEFLPVPTMKPDAALPAAKVQLRPGTQQHEVHRRSFERRRLARPFGGPGSATSGAVLARLSPLLQANPSFQFVQPIGARYGMGECLCDLACIGHFFLGHGASAQQITVRRRDDLGNGEEERERTVCGDFFFLDQ